jgi:hypothetical protein
LCFLSTPKLTQPRKISDAFFTGTIQRVASS